MAYGHIDSDEAASVDNPSTSMFVFSGTIMSEQGSHSQQEDFVEMLPCSSKNLGVDQCLEEVTNPLALRWMKVIIAPALEYHVDSRTDSLVGDGRNNATLTPRQVQTSRHCEKQKVYIQKRILSEVQKMRKIKNQILHQPRFR
jgi:hypothetical protein